MALSIRRRRVVRELGPAPEVLNGSRSSRSLRASAVRLPFTLLGRQVNPNSKIQPRLWQEEAWGVFDDVPEIKYATWFMGNVMAKAKLFVAVIDPTDPEAEPIPATDPGSGIPLSLAIRAQLELDRLKGELGGQPEVLRAINMNLEITGEGYIIGLGPRTEDVVDEAGQVVGQNEIPENWGVYSISQVTSKDGTYVVKLRIDDKAPIRLDPTLDSEPIRIFQRHPRFSLEADCTMRGALSDCEALVLLTNSIKAQAKSTMSAGFLLIPNELTAGKPGAAGESESETEPEDEEEAATDPFMQAMYDGITEPVENPGAASAVAPTMIRGPAEALKEFRHVLTQRDGDQTIMAKIAALIERVARAINLPVEVVMGHQSTTFANASQVKQDTFDEHFEPRLVLVCDAISVGFLRPNLIAAGLDETIAERLVCWYDPSKMIKQVNPVDSADQGITLNLLSEEAWRRAKGWSEDDAPDPVERLIRSIMHLRTFDPGISTAILSLLGVPLEIPQALPGKDTTGGTGAAPAAAASDRGSVEAALAAVIAARYKGQDPKDALDAIVRDVAERDPEAVSAAASALPSPAKVRKNAGHDLMMIDRELRMRILTAADSAMQRALEKAGNRLRSKSGQTRTLARAGFIHPMYVAQHLGRKIVASAGFSDSDLVGVDAWAALETQFRTWVEAAQRHALAVIEKSAPSLTPAQITNARALQSDHVDEAWRWMRAQLTELAHYRLFQPDVDPAQLGEIDVTSRIPAGLVRRALAIAGGATKLRDVEKRRTLSAAARRPGGDMLGAPVYVAVNDGQPLGGVATGETALALLSDGSAGVDAYEWTYGPAYRLHPFEPHEELDGEIFADFESDVLASGDEWIGDYYFPGDHDGCNCDFTPIIVEQGAIEDSASAAGLTELGVPTE